MVIFIHVLKWNYTGYSVNCCIWASNWIAYWHFPSVNTEIPHSKLPCPIYDVLTQFICPVDRLNLLCCDAVSGLDTVHWSATEQAGTLTPCLLHAQTLYYVCYRVCDVTCTTAGGNRQPWWQQTTTVTITALVILLKLLVICTVSALVWLAPGAVLCGRKEVLLLNKYSYHQEKTRPKQQLCVGWPIRS